MTNKPEDDHLEQEPSIARCEDVSGEKMTIIPKSGADDALEIALDNQEETWTEEEERRILWKIDLTVLPLVSLRYAEYYVARITAF